MFFFDDYVKSQNDEKIITDSFNNPLILGYLMDKWLMDNNPEEFRWVINSVKETDRLFFLFLYTGL